MVKRNPLLQLMVLVCALGCASWTKAAPEFDIEFGFNSKPPLFYFDEGRALGDVVDVVRQACLLADLKCGFVELPFQRVMVYLEQRRPGFAALGFSKTPEREKFVTFSEPVWRDDNPVLLVRSGDKKAFQTYTSLADMVSRSTFVFGGKIGNVYPIDEQLRAMGARDTRFSGEAQRFPFLLVAKRFDFTLMYPSELAPALQGSGVVSSAVEVMTYPDMPTGAERHLLFSKEVALEVVKKLDAALIKLRKRGKIPTLK